MIKKNILSVCLIFLAGFLVYAGALNSSFHFDDYSFVVNNLALREIGHLSGLWNLMQAPTRFVTLFTFVVNYQLHGLNVVGYHVTNTLIHCLTAALIFWFMRMLVSVPRIKEKLDAQAGNWIPILTALFFIAHPVQTQAVTYISQRFASLATFFYILSMCFYLKARIPTKNDKNGRAHFILSIFAGLLGMFSKEIVITLPLMIVFVESFLFKGAIIRRNKWIFLGLLAAILIIPAMYSFNVQSMLFSPRPSESHPGDIITLGPYLLTQLRVFARFFRLFFIPSGLNLDYDFPLSYTFGEAGVWTGLALVIGLILTAYYGRKKYPLITIGIVWFMATFLPNLIPRANVIFEHKMYLISIGLCITFVSGIFYFVRLRKVQVVLLTVIIVILGLLTVQRNKVWRNDITLWSDVVKKSPDKFRPHLNLGRAYMDYGRYDLAEKLFLKALELDPNHAKALNNLGLVAQHYKNYDQAMNYYNRAIAGNPNHPKTYLNRGALYRTLGKKDLALKDYQKALDINPKYSIVYVNRGNIFASEGKFKEAVADYTRAINDYVNYEEAYRNRGNAYRFLGEFDLALADFNRALEINPRSGAAYYYRSFIYFKQKELELARRDAMMALKLGYKLPARYLKQLNIIPPR